MRFLAIALATALTAVASSAADDARWIWYPGDYGIWWGNNLQAQRLQWGARLAPFWPQYEPHSRVCFRRAVKIEEDEEVEVRCDGSLAFCWVDGSGYHEGAAVFGRVTLPAGTTLVELKTQNSARPPSVWVRGRTFASDSSWTCGWRGGEDLPAECSARFTDPAAAPGLRRLPVRERRPAWVKKTDGGHLLADFGEETYGYLRFLDVKRGGRVRVVYAESEAEMREDGPDARLDGWEAIEVPAGREYRREIPHGFRYVHVIPLEEGVDVGSLTMDYEWKDVPLRGSFRCDDEELNRIWDVAVHTLELTCREVFIEGVKRDHWVWSGDAVQSFLMSYYTFADYDGCRDTLWTLRGKDPVVMHLNSIMDYTFYWFDAVEKYRLYSGDRVFAAQVYPRMKSLLEWAIARLDGDGRPADRPGDWMFIDWAPGELHNHGGVTCFEQMLFVRALEATAACAHAVGAGEDAAAYRARAEKLRAEVKPLFWSEERGALMHLLKADGSLDGQLTRYPNMFGIFFGYFDAAERDSVVRNVLLNDDVMKIQTPYMRFYELEALCAVGMQDAVLKEIKSYWGGMLKLGATSFWELYNPAESGARHYAMYGRPYGKSLCHAWGASPVYLLGRYFAGVEPTAPGFSEYAVRPALGGLKFLECRVPTPGGEISVRVDAAGCTVKGAPGCRGRLYYGGREYEIAPGAELKAPSAKASRPPS